MKKIVFLSISLPILAFAGAYDQLRNMTAGGSGYIPPVSNPECVQGCESTTYEEEGTRRTLFDVIRERSEEAALQADQKRQADERAQKQEAFNLNAQGNRAFEKKQWSSAIEFYKKALEKSPYDKVIKSNLEGAERENQRILERKNAQDEYHKKIQRFSALMPKQKAQVLYESKVPPLSLFPKLTSLQYKEYLEVKNIVNNLYIKLNREGVLSDADSNQFYTALNRRNELWNIAVQGSMNSIEREKFKLSLPHVINKSLLNLDSIRDKIDPSSKTSPNISSVHTPDRRTSKEDAITMVFTSDFFADQTGQMVEYQAGEAIENVHGSIMKDRYEKLLGLTHIVLEAKDNGTAGAVAETIDFMISKMPEPMSAQASMAVEGGRVYSNVTYRALDRFMTDAMKGTGSNFDSETFWKQFNEDLTLSQKGIKQWVQFGE